jgi:hypothetical protein
MVRVPGYRTERYCGSCEVGTEYTSICYVEESWPPLLCSQRSWLQIPRSGFDSRRYQSFLEVVGLKRGPLSLVSTTEELLGRKSSCPGLENREYGRRNPSRWPRCTLYRQKLALTLPTSGGRPVGVVRSRTKATEFEAFLRIMNQIIPLKQCNARLSRLYIPHLWKWHVCLFVCNLGLFPTQILKIGHSWFYPRLSKTKLNSMVWVRERTIPTEWPPLVGEVIANFCG